MRTRTVLLALGFAASFVLGQDFEFADQQVVPPEGAEEIFAWRIEVTDELVVVSAHEDWTAAPRAGSILLYDRDSLELVDRLFPPDARLNDRFGFALDVSGDILAVGGVDALLSSGAPEGSAYAFSLSSRKPLFRVTRPGVEDGVVTGFGYSVATDGTRVVVGALADQTSDPSRGKVYVYDLDGNLIHELFPPTDPLTLRFGFAVHIEEGVIFVGAPGGPRLGQFIPGSVFFFDADTGEMIGSASEGSDDAFFGASLAQMDGILFVGAPDNNFTGGSVFMIDPESGTRLGQFNNPESFYQDFGAGIAVDQGYLFTTSHDPLGGTGPDRYYAHFFKVPEGVAVARMGPEPGFTARIFDRSPAMRNGRLFLGARPQEAEGLNDGVLYLFDFSPCVVADLAEPRTILDFNDLLTYLGMFSDASVAADLAAPFGILNFNDVIEYLTLFSAGCP